MPEENQLATTEQNPELRYQTFEEYLGSEEGQLFISDCKATFVEGVKKYQYDMFEMKWLLGKRIVQEEALLARAPYGQKVITTLAIELHISPANLYQTISFFKKYQDVSTDNFEDIWMAIPNGANLSWFRFAQEVLPRVHEEVNREEQALLRQENCNHTNFVCKDCKKQMNISEIQAL